MIAALRPDVSVETFSEADPHAVPEDVRLGLPDAEWTRDELDRRADWEVEKTRRKRSSAAAYWWLGMVIKVVEAGFERWGDQQGWTDWCEKRGVNRTREYRSRLYAAEFESVEELSDLTIRKADRLARERRGDTQPQIEEGERLRRRLRQLKNRSLPEILRDLTTVEDCWELSPLLAEVDELWQLVQEAARQRVSNAGSPKSQDQRPKNQDQLTTVN